MNFRLRDGYLFIDGGCQLTKSDLQCIIDCVCCCAWWVLFGLFFYILCVQVP